MATTIKRNGFGQVEANHMSFQQTGQIYAQLPAHIKAGESDNVATITKLENGQFVKYDYENNEINFSGAGEWMLVFNEVKLYGDTYGEMYKDYAMQSKNFNDGVIVPRVCKTNVGDIYTTNCVGAANTYRNDYVGISLSVGDKLAPNASGFLNVVTGEQNLAAAPMLWNVVKEYTMADGQPAVKLQRIK